MRPKAIILLACLFMLLILHVFPSVDALAQRGISVARNQPSGSSRRVALVIGNAAYRESPLKNPVNDARSMASALKQLGFSVIEGEDLTFRQMRRKFIEFGREIDKGGVGLFYYAGHGVQVNGRNYLLPVGAEIKHEEEVEVEGVALDSLLARMAGAKNGLNIIILDACRNNPYERSFRSGGSRGLAQVVAPKGTVIAYATAPGKTAADGSGRHGVFTEAILRHIQNPNYDLEDFFKQVGRTVDSRTSGTQRPWMASDYYGQFAFAPTRTASLQATPAPASKPLPAVSKPKATAGPAPGQPKAGQKHYYLACRNGGGGIKGKRIRAVGKYWPALVKKSGGVPVVLPGSEIFMAIKRGVIDCAIVHPDLYRILKVHEVAPVTMPLSTPDGHITYLVGNTKTMAGKKVAVLGFPVNIINKYGGTPVTLGFGELVPALQRGVIDGILTTWSGKEYLSEKLPGFKVTPIK